MLLRSSTFKKKEPIRPQPTKKKSFKRRVKKKKKETTQKISFEFLDRCKQDPGINGSIILNVTFSRTEIVFNILAVTL